MSKSRDLAILFPLWELSLKLHFHCHSVSVPLPAAQRASWLVNGVSWREAASFSACYRDIFAKAMIMDEYSSSWHVKNVLHV